MFKHSCLYIAFFLVFVVGILNGQNNLQVSTIDVVRSVFRKGLTHCELDFYAGTFMLHGMSEFNLLKGNGVFARSQKDVVVYGNVRDMEGLHKMDGFNGWIKGSDSSCMRKILLSNINAPIRIGHATVIPFDAVWDKKMASFLYHRTWSGILC